MTWNQSASCEKVLEKETKNMILGHFFPFQLFETSGYLDINFNVNTNFIRTVINTFQVTLLNF